MINKKIWVSIIALVALVALCFSLIQENSRQKDILHLSGEQFMRVSWTEFPNNAPYKLYHLGKKKKFLCKGSTTISGVRYPSFHQILRANGVTYATFGGDYIRCCADDVIVLDWGKFTEEYEIFSTYLRWIIQNGSFFDKLYIVKPMYANFSDNLAEEFIVKFIGEDPNSSFFPDDFRAYESYRDRYLNLLEQKKTE